MCIPVLNGVLWGICEIGLLLQVINVSQSKTSHYAKEMHLNLTLKHWETHGYIVSTVATDALVLKHQAIIIHNAD